MKNCNCDGNLTVIGGSIEITSSDLKEFESGGYGEMRADITLNGHRAVRLWGRIRIKDEDSSKSPVPFALLKLVKVCNGKSIGIAHTVADCNGYYQFDVCPEEGCKYKILASKPNTGGEYNLKPKNNCEEEYNPCPCNPPEMKTNI